jgi:hypothetical protein
MDPIHMSPNAEKILRSRVERLAPLAQEHAVKCVELQLRLERADAVAKEWVDAVPTDSSESDERSLRKSGFLILPRYSQCGSLWSKALTCKATLSTLETLVADYEAFVERLTST